MAKAALIVGIDEYPNLSNKNLQGCENDAREVGKALARNYDGSPNFETIYLLPSITPQLISASMLRRMLERLFSREINTALFYFSGHGSEDGLGGYLITQDTGPTGGGLPMQDIITLANHSRINEIIIILDCCNAGRLANDSQLLGQNSTGKPIAFLRKGLTIITASRQGEAAMESNGQGAFTSKFVDAIQGEAADVLGNITLSSIYHYIDKLFGPFDQRPVFKSHVSSTVLIRKHEPALRREILTKIPVYFPDPNRHKRLSPSYQPNFDPPHPEHEAEFADLQKMRAVNLVTPVDELHMYYAAIRSKKIKLTPMGVFIWKLVQEGRL